MAHAVRVDIGPGMAATQSPSQRRGEVRGAAKSESEVIVRCSKNCRAIEQSAEHPLRAFAQVPRFPQVEMAVLAGLCEGVGAYLLLQCC